MKIEYYTICFLLFVVGCTQSDNKSVSSEVTEHEHAEEVHLSLQKFQALGIKVDTLAKRTMENYVETNGYLILPPQSQAAITSIVGANIASVEVHEGTEVKKGDVLAYLVHPNLIELQTKYANHVTQLAYMEQEYLRQEKLYSESVGSGRDFQKVKADYLSLKGSVKGMEAQLKLLAISPRRVKSGQIMEKIPLMSPISGQVQHIAVRTGQYVSPQEILFEVIQNEHIHGHFKVFESDIQKIEKGQSVKFSVESQPDTYHSGIILNVGKQFENDLKAINLHTEVENEDGLLLPGMYARGHIIIEEQKVFALPKDAVAMDGDRYYIFAAEQVEEEGVLEWHFSPTEISIGLQNDDWLEIKLHEALKEGTRFAWNNAYYLIAELQKEEAGHDH